MEFSSDLKEFIGYLKLKILTAKISVGGVNALKLTTLAILDSLPIRVMERIPLLKKFFVEKFESRVVKNVQVQAYGCRFHVIDSESLLVISPLFEELVLKTLIDLMHQNRGHVVFVDIGAHIGKYAVLMAKLIGKRGFVIAIEPCPKNYAILVRNLKLNNLKNVVALPIGLWNSEGEIELFTSFRYGWHSTKRDYGLGSVRVRVTTLDNLLGNYQITGKLIIKIDVEGAEPEVLEGSLKTIQKHHPIIICEAKRENYPSIRKLAETINYSMLQIDRENYLLEPQK